MFAESDSLIPLKTRTQADALAEGFAGGTLRVAIRSVSGQYSGAEFGRSQYNTVGIAHRDTDVYRSLEKDPDKNFIALAYRSRSNQEGMPIGDWHEEQDYSNALSTAVNSTSQIHDGFNALVSSTGNPELSNGFYNVATMLPAYAAAQHLDQSSFWNNYETYR